MKKPVRKPPGKKALKKREDAVAATPSQEQSLVRIDPSVTKCDEELHVTCNYEIKLPQIGLDICGVISWASVS